MAPADTWAELFRKFTLLKTSRAPLLLAIAPPPLLAVVMSLRLPVKSTLASVTVPVLRIAPPLPPEVAVKTARPVPAGVAGPIFSEAEAASKLMAPPALD